jgi:hypothetical protein
MFKQKLLALVLPSTAKTQYRKFKTNIPEKELHGHSPNFHIHVSVSDLYIFPGSVHIFSCSRIGRSTSREYINRSQTHECGYWDCGRAIPFLGIFVSNFWYWFFAVLGSTSASSNFWLKVWSKT